MAPLRNILSEGADTTSGTSMMMMKKEKRKNISFILGGLASSLPYFDNLALHLIFWTW